MNSALDLWAGNPQFHDPSLSNSYATDHLKLRPLCVSSLLSKRHVRESGGICPSLVFSFGCKGVKVPDTLELTHTYESALCKGHVSLPLQFCPIIHWQIHPDSDIGPCKWYLVTRLSMSHDRESTQWADYSHESLRLDAWILFMPRN